MPVISRRVRRRMLKLLNMQYTPAEIASELGVSKHTVYKVWLPGAPHTSVAGRLWIVGTELRAWAESDAVTHQGND